MTVDPGAISQPPEGKKYVKLRKEVLDFYFYIINKYANLQKNQPNS